MNQIADYWATNNLSPEQLKPFNRRCVNASILAGAGSGKTRTLTHLIANDIVSGISPDDIVVFTFTKNAAEELRARITHLLSAHGLSLELAKLKVGTIHSWCLHFLLEVDEFINFSPIEDLHLEILITRLYDYLELEDAYGLPFPKAVGKFVADLEVFQNELLNVEEVPVNIRRQIELFQSVATENKLLTFGDMIRHCCNYFRKHGPVTNLRAIYIDEYQDVNPAQVSLVKLMRPSDCELVVVGDDLQCIYQWRGSDVSQILEFEFKFPNSERFMLLENHRSRPLILDAANRFSSRVNRKLPDKILQAKRTPLEISPILWTSFAGEQSEVDGVVNIVKQFLIHGVPENKIAILFRSVANRGKPFVDALRANGISVWCPIHGRADKFILEFVEPALSWIVSDHVEPSNEEQEKEQEVKIAEMQDRLLQWIHDRIHLESFWLQLNKWLESAESGSNDAYNVRDQLYTLMDVANVRSRVDDSNLMSGLGIVSQIIRSVEEIHRRQIKGHQRKSAKGVVREILYAIRRHYSTYGESVPIDQSTKGVWVGTIHQAKGLEWPIVVIPMLKKRRFPIASKRHGTNFDDSVAVRYGTKIDDERRLFYVAITRAKERLILSNPCLLNPHSCSEFFNSFGDLTNSNKVELPNNCSKFWDIDEKDLQDSYSESVYIGLSDLLLYLECPYQFSLRRNVGVQAAVGDELGYGLGLHELIQRRINHGGDWSSVEVGRISEAQVYLPLMSDRAERVAKKSMAKRILKLQELGIFDAKVLPEIPIQLVLGAAVIHGILDCLVENSDGTYVVRDWKTNIHESMICRYERQIQFYAYALQVTGRTVNFADMIDVGATESTGELVTHQVDVSDSALENIKYLLEVGIDGIINSDFSPSPAMKVCRNCDVSKICGERWNEAKIN